MLNSCWSLLLQSAVASAGRVEANQLDVGLELLKVRRCSVACALKITETC